MDYQNGKIYKLVSNVSDKVYYGSTTTTLVKRLYNHKVKYNLCKSKAIIDEDDYSMVLVEAYPCDNKMELHKRERYYIENNECVNKNIPTRNKAEYRLDNIEKIIEREKQYRLDNKEHTKQYRLDNKEHIKQYDKQYNKQYYIDNKEQIKEYKKQYRLDNKERIKERRKQYRLSKKSILEF
jgi:hypothetical protein